MPEHLFGPAILFGTLESESLYFSPIFSPKNPLLRSLLICFKTNSEFSFSRQNIGVSGCHVY